MTNIKSLDEFSFYPTLEKCEGVSLLFFTGPHCASCHHLKNLIDSEFSDFVKHFAKKEQVFHAFEIKADQATALANQFSVFHLPTMLLYLNGEFHCELQSEAITAKLLIAIDEALEKPAEEEP